LPLRELISKLQHPEPAVRRRAVETLGQMGGDEASGALVLMLRDPDETVRSLVGNTLAALGPEVIAPLTRYLAAWQGPVGMIVPTLLGRLRDERGLSLLAAHLGDPEPATRAAVATALGCIGTDRAVPPLLELLRDMTDQVRIAAARALGEVQSPAATDALLDEMADDNPQVRTAVVEALGRINNQKSVDVLSRACAEDKDPDVRRAAMVALRRVSTKAVTPLIHSLSGDDVSERIRAVSQLLDQGKASILPLTELLAHEEPTVRASAAEVLGALGDAAALESLVHALDDADARVRLSVTHALGRIKHTRSAEALARLLEDQDGKVAAAAANGLENQSELAVDRVFGLLNHESPDVRVRAIDVLGRLRHKGACDRLIRGLTDSVIWVRVVSAQALGEVGESQAAPALIAALKDRDPVVRAMAAEALGKLRDFPATMPLLNVLGDENDLVRINALRALGRIGNPAAIPFIEPALEAPEPDVRCAAIDGLAALRVTGALPKLRRMARGWPRGKEPKEVRAAARQAIATLEAALEQEKALVPEPEERQGDE
jgi:HEAT repeat protein